MNLIEHLKSFNRKERFLLLHEALGFENQSFRVSRKFCQRISDCLGVGVPEDAYVAMDYHLDWLQMALWLAENRSTQFPFRNDGLFYANQEDIDLLLAFEDKNKTQIVLIEAKGDTPWSNRQLRSKAERLELIFEPHRPGTSLATPHFIMMSPSESARIDTKTWPSWMTERGKARWLELTLPSGLNKVTRCTRKQKPNKYGTYLKIDRS